MPVKNRNRRVVVALLLLLITLSGPLISRPAFAADEAGPGGSIVGECNPGTDGIDLSGCFTAGRTSTTVSSLYSTPADLLNTIIPNVFLFAGIILFGTLIYVGFKFVSQGTKGKDEAKNILTAALAGIFLMIAAYWILQIVSFLTGVEFSFLG